MTIVSLTLSAVLAGAIVLSGCASTPISSGDEVHVRCRTAKPLTCDHIRSTSVHDTNGHIRCRTGKPLTCEHINSRDAPDTSGRRWTSHPWFKDKPWLGKILTRSTRSAPNQHEEVSESGSDADGPSANYSSWFKDKPWLGKILLRDN